MDDFALWKVLNQTAHYMHYRKTSYRGRIKALEILKEAGQEGLGQKELAVVMDIQAGSLSELLQKMENDSLIIRTKDNHDKRNSIVYATQYGLEQLIIMTEERKQRASEMFAVLTDTEKQQLDHILNKLNEDWQGKWHMELKHDEQHKHLQELPRM